MILDTIIIKHNNNTIIIIVVVIIIILIIIIVMIIIIITNEMVPDNPVPVYSDKLNKCITQEAIVAPVKGLV